MMRHVMGISGGKDSAALAIYLQGKTSDWEYFSDIALSVGHEEEAKRIAALQMAPKIEYFFTDTGKELPEVYSYLLILEKYLGKPIVRLTPFNSDADNNVAPFDHFLKAEHGGLLPSRQQRWCTFKMKLKPMENFVGTDKAINYVGIRADETVRARLSSRKNITAAYPFVQDGLVRDDIYKLLSNTAGIPKYYEWRSRSGCYFCFFQRKREWLGLRKRHPDLFQKAIEYEENTYDPTTGRMYTWLDNMTLRELASLADNVPLEQETKDKKMSWQKTILLQNLEDDDPHDHACAICSL